MDWKASLDRYLTTEPEDGFSEWGDEVFDLFTDAFYEHHESWMMEENGLCNKWMNTLYFKKNKTPKEASTIIERAFYLYVT